MANKTRTTKQPKPSNPKAVTTDTSDAKASGSGVPRLLNARPDGLDFRDQMYVPTLVEVPLRRDLADYRAARTPILAQGREGACTGYDLAAVARYLLRVRKIDPDTAQISPSMLYALARRYGLVLYAHGGLVGKDSAIQLVSDYQSAMLETECYPLAFIWKSDYWSTLKNMPKDAANRRCKVGGGRDRQARKARPRPGNSCGGP